MSGYIWNLTQEELYHKQNFSWGQGILHERERIIALVNEVWEGRCSPVMEPDECSVCWLVSNIIEKIEESK